MEEKQAKTPMDGLAPITGEVSPSEETCQDDKTVIDLYQAIEILKQQANKIDPYTGKIYETNGSYENIQLSGALFQVIEFVKERLPKIPHVKRIINARLRSGRKAQLQSERKPLPDRAGRAWRNKESELIVERFESGMPIAEIAKLHQRSENSIAARLVRIGKVSSRDEARMGIRPKE